jgi:hypothetical protein
VDDRYVILDLQKSHEADEDAQGIPNVNVVCTISSIIIFNTISLSIIALNAKCLSITRVTCTSNSDIFGRFWPHCNNLSELIHAKQINRQVQKWRTKWNVWVAH